MNEKNYDRIHYIAVAIAVALATVVNCLLHGAFLSLDSFILSSTGYDCGVENLSAVALASVAVIIIAGAKSGFLSAILSGVILCMMGDVSYLITNTVVVGIIAFVMMTGKFGKMGWRFLCSVLVSLFYVLGNMISYGEYKFLTLPVIITKFFWYFVAVFIISNIFMFIARKTAKTLGSLFVPTNSSLFKTYREHSINRELTVLINLVAAGVLVFTGCFSGVFYYAQLKENVYSSANYIKGFLIRDIEQEAGNILSGDTTALNSVAVRLGRTITDAYTATSGNADVTRVYFYKTDESGENRIILADYNLIISEDENGNAVVTAKLNSNIGETIPKNTETKPATVDAGFDLDGFSAYIELSYNNKEEMYTFIVNMISIGVAIMIVMNYITEKRIEKRIVRPINSMSAAAYDFAYDDDGDRTVEESRFAELDIKSGDEIENLYICFLKTMADMQEYIDSVKEQSEHIAAIQHNIIITMADIVESRDESTGGHIKRTAAYVEIIAKKLKSLGKFTDILTDDYIADMIIAAPLHDMGKIHVSDTILNKNGKLNEDEFKAMQVHTTAGKQLLENATKNLGEFSYLSVAVQMAAYHHEKYNGKGYPYGLAGEEIPLCARIMAVADVFDALVSKRCYKPGMPLEKAYKIIFEESGSHFDSEVVTAFFEAKDEIEAALHQFE